MSEGKAKTTGLSEEQLNQWEESRDFTISKDSATLNRKLSKIELGKLNDMAKETLNAMTLEALREVAETEEIGHCNMGKEVLIKRLLENVTMLKTEKRKTKEVVRREVREKDLKRLTIDKLRAMAGEVNISGNGAKADIVVRILDNQYGVEKTAHQIHLKDALMSWQCSELRNVLMEQNKPGWGNKETMVQRVQDGLDIDVAVDIIQEYRVYLEERKNKGEDKNDEKKRKRIGKQEDQDKLHSKKESENESIIDMEVDSNEEEKEIKEDIGTDKDSEEEEIKQMEVDKIK